MRNLPETIDIKKKSSMKSISIIINSLLIDNIFVQPYHYLCICTYMIMAGYFLERVVVLSLVIFLFLVTWVGKLDN